MKRTALNCPEHSNCVCVLETIPEAEELNGRKALRLPDPYHWWLVAHQEQVIAVEHHDTPDSPNGLLVGDLIIAPKDIGARMHDAERVLTSHRESLVRLDDRIFAGEMGADQLREDLTKQETEVAEARRNAIEADRLIREDMTQRLNDMEMRLTRIEEFITRKPRLKRAWEKEVGLLG